MCSLLEDYIISPDILLNISDLNIIHRKIDENKLLNISKCPASTTLTAERDHFTGEIIDFIETPINHAGADAKNSMSYKRAPGAVNESVRGSAMNFPFWPGGLIDENESELENLCANNFDFEENNRCTIPPGFSHGIDFKDDEYIDDNEDESVVNLISALEKDMVIDEWIQIKDGNITNKTNDSTELQNITDTDNSIDDVLMANPNENKILQISSTQTKQIISEWAEMIDTTQPVLDFKEKIPEPAMTFPFELDNFQKQAILKLEERKYVFVAAHTSAGKTVIAEYAIALSQNHMTRTIYTSPIKALSNQKYRDFKNTFKNVGLITGDLQIDPDASCLIVTTEILRSMLFCGSDITRDLEYVIFDEVHYINDADRGHVWEEVIMLLPDHVNIIMLSATVPNSQELADWVGSIKKRKVYVCSTLKRPVPLMHYLYVGSGGKSNFDKDIFLVVNSNKQFLIENYNKAKKEKEPIKFSKNIQKQDQTRWSSLIDFLKRKEKLPVVAFTLSRNRCDKNVDALSSTDLNTNKEKAAVQIFFQKCLARLKADDRDLKQVLKLQSSLERGIGIHHSGILPILKEIVEMLFQKGLVKILFATETFAMGVNMPARTVIFDSHMKYDGNELRLINTSEYTQMAGRAGRRGHDENGTVIILCKKDVPEVIDLRKMILGQPERLQSKFILRYAVILTCLRIENIKVEDIMKHSFIQFKVNNTEEHKQLLEEAESKLVKMKEVDEEFKPFSDFYDIAYEYLEVKRKLMKIILMQPKNIKKLNPGKIVIITSGKHYNKLGILLNIKIQNVKEPILKVLVLDHQNNSKVSHELPKTHCDLWHNMVSLIPKHKIFTPYGVGGHCVVCIKLSEITSITKSQIKISDPDVIIKNWDQRQIERFKDSPPGPTLENAVADLKILNDNYPNNIQILNLLKELPINDDDILEILSTYKTAEEKLNKIISFTDIPNFEEDFLNVFDKKILETTINKLKFEISPQNLSLYPDYLGKLNVLRELKYVDENDEVTLKGKIACEMGQNELFKTELILCNIFNNLDSAEIAALLSGLVFQAKTNVEIKAPNDKIKKCMVEFEDIWRNIQDTEVKLQIKSEAQLNFGLIHVVYEWARNKPFCEITNLTDIQEGIIVRCIQQLVETIQDVRTAAMRIGNPTLQSKMEEASTAIKRDIVFTASLYTAL